MVRRAFYIVCSLVEGPTLADRLRDGPLEQAAAAHVIATIADALSMPTGRASCIAT